MGRACAACSTSGRWNLGQGATACKMYKLRWHGPQPGKTCSLVILKAGSQPKNRSCKPALALNFLEFGPWLQGHGHEQARSMACSVACLQDDDFREQRRKLRFLFALNMGLPQVGLGTLRLHGCFHKFGALLLGDLSIRVWFRAADFGNSHITVCIPLKDLFA